MTMHSEDWARLYGPLVGELIKALFWTIFGKQKTKKRYYNDYHRRSGHGR